LPLKFSSEKISRIYSEWFSFGGKGAPFAEFRGPFRGLERNGMKRNFRKKIRFDGTANITTTKMHANTIASSKLKTFFKVVFDLGWFKTSVFFSTAI
jgi:hypothetical protein